MKKQPSPKQIEANRNNALRSTGPKTQDGKAISRMNALKHGVLARHVVVRGHKIQESSHEFKLLCRQYHEHLLPVGPLEEMLVNQIVTTTWRLRRAHTAEMGEIALSVDEGWWRRSRGIHPAMQWMRWEAFGDPIPGMQDSLLGNDVIKSHLDDVRADVEREGGLSEAAVQKVIDAFGGKSNSLTRKLEKHRLQMLENPDGLDAAALRERNKAATLAFLNDKLRKLSWRQSDCEKRENQAEEAQQAANVLPSAEKLEKILRYETAMERQLFRAMNQLERLQRRRLGENVPAPVTVEVSTRN